MVRTRPHTEEASREAAARAILQGRERAAAEPALLIGGRPGTADTALLADLAAGLPLVLSARDGEAAAMCGVPEMTATASTASLHLGSPWGVSPVQAELRPPVWEDFPQDYPSGSRQNFVMPAAEPLSPPLSSPPPPSPPLPPPPSSPSAAQLMAAHAEKEEIAMVRRHVKVAEMRASEARRKQARLERHEAQRGAQARRQCEARQAVAAALEARRQAERGEQEERRRRVAEEVRLRLRRRQGEQSEPGGSSEVAAVPPTSPTEYAAGGPHAAQDARAATDAEAGDFAAQAPSPLEAYGGAVAPELPPELPRARTAPAGLRRPAAQRAYSTSPGGGVGGGFHATSCTLGGGFVVRAPYVTSHGLLRLTSQNLTPASRAASASVRGRGHGCGGGGGGGGMARPPPPQSPPPQRLDPRVRHAAMCHAKIRAALAAADEPPGWNERLVHSKTPAFTREWAKHLPDHLKTKTVTQSSLLLSE